MTGNSVEPWLCKIFTPGYSTWILNHTDNDIDADMRRSLLLQGDHKRL